MSLPALAALWPLDVPMYGIMREFMPRDSFLPLERALSLANISHPLLEQSFSEAPAIPMYDEFDGFDGHAASDGRGGAGKADRTGIPDWDKKMSPSLPLLAPDAHAALLKADALRSAFWRAHYQATKAWHVQVCSHMLPFLKKRASHILFHLKSAARSTPQGREPAFVPNSYAFLVFREGRGAGIFMPEIGLRMVKNPDSLVNWYFLIGLLCIARNVSHIRSLVLTPAIPAKLPNACQ